MNLQLPEPQAEALGEGSDSGTFSQGGVRTRSQLVRIAIEKHSLDWLQPEPVETNLRG
jgi:hypothetical protein